MRERSILSFQRAQLAGRDARALEGVWRLPGFLVSFPIGTDFENHRRSSTFENRLWWIGNDRKEGISVKPVPMLLFFSESFRNRLEISEFNRNFHRSVRQL